MALDSDINPRIRQLAEHIARAMVEELWARMRRGDPPISLEYVTADQFAAMTGISTSTLERWRSTRTGPPYFKVGGRRGRVRYKAADVRAWVERGGPVE